MTKKRAAKRNKKRGPLIFYVEQKATDRRVPACKDMDPTEFVGPDTEGNAEREWREAKAKIVCSQCTLIAECLTWAVGNKEVGIWGRTNDEERAAIRRSKSKQRPTGVLTTQQANRIMREELAWDLSESKVSRAEIAKRLGVTEGTVYEYIRAQRNVRNHEANQGAGPAEAEGNDRAARSSDPERPETAVLGRV